MNITSNLHLAIANSLANTSHGWNLIRINEYSISSIASDGYGGYSTSTSPVTDYVFKSNAIFLSNTSNTALSFTYTYVTSDGGSFANAKVSINGASYTCPNNMLYANINLKANTYLNTQSSSLLSLFQTGPVTKPSINTTLLTNLNNSFVNNAGQWSVLSKNDLDMFVDGEVQRVSQVFLASSKYRIRDIKMVMTYHAVLDKTGSLKEAQITLNGAQYSTKDATLYSSITSLANTFNSTRETELLSVIV